MRITFDGKELSWLHTYTNSLVDISSKRDDYASQVLYAQAARMRSKFTPAATVVYMKKNERALVASLAEYRLKSLDATQSYSEEGDIVKSIIKKITPPKDVA